MSGRDVPTAIPISCVAIGPEEERLVVDVLRSGQLAQGPMVRRLEEELATLTGSRHAVAVSNGTAALICALLALRHVGRLEPGDEVITSSFTFVATLNAALRADLGVRFADIGSDFCMRPDAVSRLVNERTRALVPVHLYGMAADMPALTEIAEEHGLAIVEDAAQAIGATCAGRPVGSYGTACFSFYATKNVAAGEGGAVTTEDDEIAAFIRRFRNQGMVQRYQYEMIGENLRMTDLQAAIALGQLGRLTRLIAARQSNAEQLSRGLAGLPGLQLPEDTPQRRSVWHQYTVRVQPAARRTRDELTSLLSQSGIGSGVYYPRPVFAYDCFRKDPRVRAGPVPEAEAACAEVLSLPVHAGLDAGAVERIISTVRSVLA